MKNADKELGAVLQSPEISEATYHRWQNQYGGIKASEAKRLKELEDQNRKLKEIVADQQLDIKMLKHLSEGNW
ncbi:MAG: transposase [Planctomycetaceae bacterium]|nr:transposase [Planctomycetaceae bacterium]